MGFGVRVRAINRDWVKLRYCRVSFRVKSIVIKYDKYDQPYGMAAKGGHLENPPHIWRPKNTKRNPA